MGGSVGGRAEGLAEGGRPSGESTSGGQGEGRLLTGEADVGGCSWAGEAGFEVPRRWNRRWDNMADGVSADGPTTTTTAVVQWGWRGRRSRMGTQGGG